LGVFTLDLAIILSLVIVIDPVRPNKIDPLPDLFDQLVQRLLMLAVVAGSLFAKQSFALACHFPCYYKMGPSSLEVLLVLLRGRSPSGMVMVVTVVVVVVSRHVANSRRGRRQTETTIVVFQGSYRVEDEDQTIRSFSECGLS